MCIRDRHKYIEECCTMYIWFRIGYKLITPKLTDSILDGITRNSIITLARDIGIVVEEIKVLVYDLIEAYDAGQLKEVFGTGTAVAVSPITSITFREKKMIFPTAEDSFALRLKEQMHGIQRGEFKDTYGWTTKIISRDTIS